LLKLKQFIEKTGLKVKSDLKFDLGDNSELKDKIAKSKAESLKSTSVDLAFCMDCTGSMSGWMQEAKKRVVSISHQLKSQYSRMKLRMAFVCYRDIKDVSPPRFQLKQFTEDIESVETFIHSLVANGGGDTPEDVLGGLNQALNLNWSSDARVLIHVGDAPPHGKIFHSSDDDYPDGDPNGLTHYTVLKNVRNKKIDYHFIKVNNICDKMIKLFSECYDDYQNKMMVHDLSDSVSSLTPTVVSAVGKSVMIFKP